VRAVAAIGHPTRVSTSTRARCRTTRLWTRRRRYGPARRRSS
jgi:hypothetical protein